MARWSNTSRISILRSTTYVRSAEDLLYLEDLGPRQSVREQYCPYLLLRGQLLDLVQLSRADAVGVMQTLPVLNYPVNHFVANALCHRLNLIGSRRHERHYALDDDGPHFRNSTWS